MAKVSFVSYDLVNFASEGMVTRSDALTKLESFSDLEDGWHYGMGKAPSFYVRSIAKTLVSYALSLGLTHIDVFPGKNGEITVAIYRGYVDHSFQVRSDISFRYWIESDPDSEFISISSMPEVLEKIKQLIRIPWNSFTTSTFGTGIKPKAISEAKHLKTQVMELGFLPFKPIVLSLGLGVFALTHVGSTSRGSAQNHQYSGNLMNETCQTDSD